MIDKVRFSILNCLVLRFVLIHFLYVYIFFLTGDQLMALVTFDREEKKSYNLPIAITDSGHPPMTGTSSLIVVIGDVNDNKMKSGESSIFIYNYKVILFFFLKTFFFFI